MAQHARNNSPARRKPSRVSQPAGRESGAVGGSGARPASGAARADAGAYQRGNERYATRGRRRGRRSPWRVVFWVALVVLVVSLGALAYVGYTYWSGQRAYDKIASDYFEVPDGMQNGVQDGAQSASLVDFNVDWDALREVNPDVVGWVYIPDTEVSYPIVHRDGDDSYYLTHTFSGDTAGSFGADFGCIMLSGENSADFSDEVNVIYGHNMANGSMFATLAGFGDSTTFNQHRTIYVLTPQGGYQLSTFAVNRVSGTDASIVAPNQGADELLSYVQARLDASLVVPDPAPSAPADITQVFAFSTCDGADSSYRIITFAEVVEYVPENGAADTTNHESADREGIS